MLCLFVSQGAAKLQSVKLWGLFHHPGLEPGPPVRGLTMAKWQNFFSNLQLWQLVTLQSLVLQRPTVSLWKGLSLIKTILSIQFEPMIWSEKYLSLYRGMHTEPFHWSISIFACKSWQANIFVKLLCVNMSLYFSWKSSFLKWHLLPLPVKSNF